MNGATSGTTSAQRVSVAPQPQAAVYAQSAPQPGAYTASYDPRPARAIDPVYQRQEVAFDGGQPSGTIVVDTTNKFLYLVEAPGQALRYGIGVGRPGFPLARGQDDQS